MSPNKLVPDFPQPEFPDHRTELAPCRAKFVGGDFPGLQGLAGELYGYVKGQVSAGYVNALAAKVRTLVEGDPDSGGYTPSGGWVGDTASAFQAAFITDAAMMNGLNHIICAIASVYDHLASTLSLHEAYLEARLVPLGQQYNPHFALDWLEVLTIGSQRGIGPRPEYLTQFQQKYSALTYGDFTTNFSKIFAPFDKQADDDRRKAGVTLSALGDILFESIGRYMLHAAGKGSASTGDPGVFLNANQASADQATVGRLQGDLAKYSKQLNMKSGDDSDAKDMLAALGVKAGQASALLGDIGSAKKAEGLLAGASSAGKILSDAEPLLEIIGLFGMAAL
jgi:hypothetical protein